MPVPPIAPPIDFSDPHWLQTLLLYIATAWLTWMIAAARVNNRKG